MPSFLTPRRRAGLFSPRTLALSSAGVALILVLVLMRIFAPSLISAVATPVWQTGTALTGASGAFAALGMDRMALVQERDTLTKENARLVSENASLTARLADFGALRSTQNERPSDIMASVRARPPVAPYDVLVLDRGTDAGILVGALVFGPSGVPLGTIGEADARSARVLLYSASGRTVEAWAGDTHVPLTLRGRGAGAFDATIARDSAVVVGSLVYLPGDGAVPIGSVVAIDDDPSSPRASVSIKPFANPFSITSVIIAGE